MNDMNSKQASIGKLLLQTGKLSPENIDMILTEQRTHGLRFGEAAKQLKLIKQSDIDEVLASQFEFDSNHLKGKIDKIVLPINQPFSKQAEKIRSLRNQISVRWLNNSKSIMLTSPQKRSGTSMLAANMAVSFAQIGKKTLLVDANMRNPAQHEIFNVKNGLGFSDLIAGKAGLDQITEIQPLNNLTVMLSGVIPPNPAELISRGKLKHILLQLETEFDVIIFDTPSTLDYEDAIAMSSYIKGILLVIRKHKTSIKQVRKITSQLEMQKSDVVGAFINEY